ncbi:hypothetical protein PIROE2DRAFT_16011, partial [Piromyces sp. E2]
NNDIDNNIDNDNQESNSNSSSLFHREMLLKLVIENNQEYINQYISERFQRKFINYLLEHTETLSHIINDKDLKYINSFNIEDISKRNSPKTPTKKDKNSNRIKPSMLIKNNKINYMVNKTKKKNTISVLEMNNNKIRNILLNHLSNNEMMRELLKYKMSMNDSSQSNETQLQHDDIEMDINVDYYKKVFKKNEYEIPENVNTLKNNEAIKNIFKLKHICPLVYLLDYKNPNIVENIVLSYIWPTSSFQNNIINNSNSMDNPSNVMNQWINFNNCVHKYFWYNDFVKYL